MKKFRAQKKTEGEEEKINDDIVESIHTMDV